MKSSGIAKVKASLSEYLSRVKRGEEVIITEHGVPVAKIVPFRTKGPTATEREGLAREGILELGKGKLSSDFLNPSPVEDPSGSLLKALIEERERET